MSKTDISEKGLEDLIVEHLVGVNGFEQGTSADYLAAEVVCVEGQETGSCREAVGVFRVTNCNF